MEASQGQQPAEPRTSEAEAWRRKLNLPTEWYAGTPQFSTDVAGEVAAEVERHWTEYQRGVYADEHSGQSPVDIAQLQQAHFAEEGSETGAGT